MNIYQSMTIMTSGAGALIKFLHNLLVGYLSPPRDCTRSEMAGFFYCEQRMRCLFPQQQLPRRSQDRQGKMFYSGLLSMMRIPVLPPTRSNVPTAQLTHRHSEVRSQSLSPYAWFARPQ